MNACQHPEVKGHDGWRREAWLGRLAGEEYTTRTVAEVFASHACALGHVQVSQSRIARTVARRHGIAESETFRALRRLRQIEATLHLRDGDKLSRTPALMALHILDAAPEPAGGKAKTRTTMVYRYDSDRECWNAPVPATVPA